MNKILLLDADGVAVAPREKYFSTRYVEDFGVSSDIIVPFFKNEFNDCLTGKKELREVFSEEDLLEKWGWKGSLDELLEYWWAGENKRNEPVLAIVKNLRAEGMKCYLATDQEKNRAQYLLRDMRLAEDFDGAFFSCDLGARKHEALYWEKVMATLGNPDPATVSFWDDEEENIEVAQKAGIDAHLFTTVEDLKRGLKI
ncbi:MAG: HAD hydrolase-like protein [Candidatus Peregrinibacteria bacterium]|nr:HAD hydrolase-like protein [Candidatus Peregrinibacteria bacterium]